MITKNLNTIRKDEVITYLRKHKDSKFDVHNIYSKKDKDEFMKHINHLIKKNSISIIILLEDRL
jgi:hypothetical protein